MPMAAAATNSPTTADGPKMTIAHIDGADNFKMLPRYSAALGRPHDDSMPAEDLDAIQLELELLLSTVAQRARALKYEFDAIDREDKRGGSGGGVSKTKQLNIDKQPASPQGKRKRGAASSLATNDEKRSKDSTTSSTGTAAAKGYFGTHKMTKVKASAAAAASPAPSAHTDDSLDAVPHFHSAHAPSANPKMVLPKNDTPNKFWMSVEPYCMPITHEDIKVIPFYFVEFFFVLLTLMIFPSCWTIYWKSIRVR